MLLSRDRLEGSVSAPSWMGNEAAPEHVRGLSDQELDPVVVLSLSVLTAVCYYIASTV